MKKDMIIQNVHEPNYLVWSRTNYPDCAHSVSSNSSTSVVVSAISSHIVPSTSTSTLNPAASATHSQSPATSTSSSASVKFPSVCSSSSSRVLSEVLVLPGVHSDPTKKEKETCTQ